MDFYEINFNKKNRRPITETTYQIDAAEWNALGKKVREIDMNGGGGTGVALAKNVIYNTGNSSLNSSNVQDAIDELSANVDTSISYVIPSTNEEGDCVLLTGLLGDGVDSERMEYPIPEATAYNAGVMPKEDKQKLDSIMPVGLIVSHNGGVALNICDTNGNIIVRFSGGHIRTKFFDSRNYSTDTTPDDMSIKGTSIIVEDADFTGIGIGDSPVVPPADLQQFAYSFPFTFGGIGIGDSPVVPPADLQQFAYSFQFAFGG